MSEESAAMGTVLQQCKTTFKVTVFRKGKTKQVLFLEAGKDFVDTLFSFLLLPIGTILHILSQGIQVKPYSGISSIYESVDSSILQVDKQDLLQPRPSAPGCTCESIRLQVQSDLEAARLLRGPPERRVLYGDYYKCSCRLCFGNVLSSDRGERCAACKHDGYTGHFSDGPYFAQKKDPQVEAMLLKSGLVKENTKFIVTDNLKIIPSNTMTIMNELKKMEVASVDDPKSDEIIVSITQILQLLHSALVSNTCINDVFGLKKGDSNFMQRHQG